MSTDRWLVKFHARDAAAFHPEAHIPVFHRWIQQNSLPVVLIDVADYAHVHEGPGVLLVSHEYNIYADCFEGKPGLTVQRKLRGGVGAESLLDTLRIGLLAIRQLEGEASLPGSKFRASDIEVVANDRLRAPNSDEGWAAAEPALQEAARKLYDGSATIRREPADVGRRLAARVSGAGENCGDLLTRLQA